MKRKMLALVVLSGIAAFASSAPRAEAGPYDCGTFPTNYCMGKPSNTVCYCSDRSGRPGWAATCGTWKIACQ